eukprot:scaffold593030_cov33-Prasinocladus_malaysianus.AAC.2
MAPGRPARGQHGWPPWRGPGGVDVVVRPNVALQLSLEREAGGNSCHFVDGEEHRFREIELRLRELNRQGHLAGFGKVQGVSQDIAGEQQAERWPAKVSENAVLANDVFVSHC